MTINSSKVCPSERRSKRGAATRREQLRKLLARKSGATLAQIEKAFSWKPHTARAAISTLRKSGVGVERDVTEKGSVYRLVVDEE